MLTLARKLNVLLVVASLWLALPACTMKFNKKDAGGGGGGDGNSAPLSTRSDTKKLIYFGSYAPDPTYCASHWQDLEQYDFFDGLTISFIDDAGHSLFGSLFSSTDVGAGGFTRAQSNLSTAIQHWKQAGRFPDNFLYVWLTPVEGSFAWSDDSLWSQIAQNAGTVARFAKNSGLKGLLLDPEQYVARIYEASTQAAAENKTAEQLDALAKTRGTQFATALLSQYPDITLLMTYSYSFTSIYPNASLYIPFLDGMVEAMRAMPGAHRIIDGSEALYGGKTVADFQAQYDTSTYAASAKNLGTFGSVADALFLEVANSSLPWSPTNFSRDLYQPSELTTAVRAALKVTDEYTWIFSNTCLFPGAGGCGAPYLPTEYVDAMRAARTQ